MLNPQVYNRTDGVNIVLDTVDILYIEDFRTYRQIVYGVGEEAVKFRVKDTLGDIIESMCDKPDWQC